MATSIRMLPLNALRSFDAAARRLSFTAAALELGVTTAAVSVQVRRLEAWVGAPLFIRGPRSVSLSTAGQTLAPRLTALFLEMNRLVSEVAQVDVGKLRVSAMPSFAARWVAPRLAGFARAHPQLRIALQGGDRPADFDPDGVDVRLRYGHGAYGDLYAERICEAVAFPVCSPELADQAERDGGGLDPRLLLHDESAALAPGLPTWTAWWAQAGVAAKPDGAGLVFGHSHMAIAAALAGQGYALALSPLVADDLARGRLVRPFPGEIVSPFGFWFVCERARLTEPKIAAFRAWIFDEAARSAAQG